MIMISHNRLRSATGSTNDTSSIIGVCSLPNNINWVFTSRCGLGIRQRTTGDGMVDNRYISETLVTTHHSFSDYTLSPFSLTNIPNIHLYLIF